MRSPVLSLNSGKEAIFLQIIINSKSYIFNAKIIARIKVKPINANGVGENVLITSIISLSCSKIKTP